MSSPLAAQAETKTIGDFNYRVEPLGARPARAALVKLGNMLGPSLATLKLASVMGAGKDAEAATEAIAHALGLLAERLTEADLDYFEKLFAPKTLVSGATEAGIEEIGEGREPVLKDRPNHFSGARLYDFFVWLTHCLMVNYAPFFFAAQQALQSSKSSKAAKPLPSDSPTGANGTIGD